MVPKTFNTSIINHASFVKFCYESQPGEQMIRMCDFSSDAWCLCTCFL